MKRIMEATSEPVELNDSQIDAVSGGCKIGEPGQDALLEQAAFFGNDPLPEQWHGPTGLLNAGQSTDCLSLFPT